MIQMLIASMLALVVPTMIVIITIMLSMKTSSDREKLSPFECGFDPNHTARIPFSLRFFLLAIIFIVFDIEIVLLMPIPMIIMTKMSYQMISIALFLLILLLGLLHEWNQGSLNWSY